MRKSWFKFVFVLVIVGAFFIVESGLAQLTTPRVSPYTSITQRIGLTDVTIAYHRPGVKGRKIWGGLEPYGLSPGASFGSGNPYPWRAGANENTTISFTNDVTIEGEPLAAGTYGLHMIISEGDTSLFSPPPISPIGRSIMSGMLLAVSTQANDFENDVPKSMQSIILGSISLFRIVGGVT